MENNNSYCYFTVSNKRRRGDIVKLNDKTVWVKFIHGTNTPITIKRHITKHDVKFIKI